MLSTKILMTLHITIVISMIIFNMGCSFLKYYIPKKLDIEQGIYLSIQDIQKIHIGMTKSEILHHIGSPILQDLFEPNTWHYVYYHCYTNGQIKSQRITLTFDLNNTLIIINTT